MKENATGITYKVKVRKKEYDVLVYDNATPSTSIKFYYCECILRRDVYLEDNITPEKLQAKLEKAVKLAIYDYNSKRSLRKLELKQEKEDSGELGFMGDLLDEKKIYLYELSDKRFKEIRGTLRIYKGNKAFVTREDNSKIVGVATEEGKVFKNIYVWLEKRNKSQAAQIFRYKIDKEINKELEKLNNLRTVDSILLKYFDTRK